MLIEKVITKQERTQVEIKLPFYSKTEYSCFCIESENRTIEVMKNLIVSSDMKYKIAEIAGYQEITEAEFLAAYVIARANTEYSLLEPISLTNGNAPY